MSSIKDEKYLLQLIKSKEVVSGEYKIEHAGSLMDLDLINLTFKDCTIIGGDFCSGSFIGCTFDNVLFKDLALVGVNFDKCNFIKCTFCNIQLDFSMNNCNVGGLIITRES